MLILGKTNMYRFNNPAQAAKLRQHRQVRAQSLHPPSVGVSVTPSSVGVSATPSSVGVLVKGLVGVGVSVKGQV